MCQRIRAWSTMAIVSTAQLPPIEAYPLDWRVVFRWITKLKINVTANGKTKALSSVAIGALMNRRKFFFVSVTVWWKLRSCSIEVGRLRPNLAKLTVLNHARLEG